MDILVLDTIHGGKPIGAAYTSRGHDVDLVDVYRGSGPTSADDALSRTYDLIVAPVHLDPGHPLLKNRTTPVITHHEAVRQLLGDDVPGIMVEITGSRGKTTTAHALAAILPGTGILHTSSGTYRYPEKTFLSRSSITPGSVLAAVTTARQAGGWLVIEESLGITGAGTLGILTSGDDYRIAAGKKSAIEAKIASGSHCRRLLVAGGIRDTHTCNSVHCEDLIVTTDTECRVSVDGKNYIFSNPLLALPAYRTPLELAAAAAAVLGIDPAPLSDFTALSGRMSARYEGKILVVDNANSGTNCDTTIEAARYARGRSGTTDITLVIGQQEGDGAVCEGFSANQIATAVGVIRPARLVWVGRFPEPGTPEHAALAPRITARAATLEEGYTLAQQNTVQGSIVLAVKTWR